LAVKQPTRCARGWSTAAQWRSAFSIRRSGT